MTTTSSHGCTQRQKEKRDTNAARGQGNTHTRGLQTLGDKKAKERRRIGKVNERMIETRWKLCTRATVATLGDKKVRRKSAGKDNEE